jgi:hypothetical protein
MRGAVKWTKISPAMSSRNIGLYFGLAVALTFAIGSYWAAFTPKHFLMGGLCVLTVWCRDQLVGVFTDRDSD